jgi:hypothetical protein
MYASYPMLPPKPKKEDIAAILDRAAALLEREDGWCKHDTVKNRSGVRVSSSYVIEETSESVDHLQFCLIGATQRACHERADALAESYSRSLNYYEEAHRCLKDSLSCLILIDTSLPTWNDEPARTQEEVVGLVKATSARLKAEKD